MEFMNRAERYAEARGDEPMFKQTFEFCRDSMSVRESVREALEIMYGVDVADLLEYQ